MTRRRSWNTRLVRSIVLGAALIGCAANPNYYSATLNQPDGLGPGDTVRHGDTPIGTVTSISAGAGGSDAQVSIQVDHQYANAVHADSILILQGAGSQPSLELMTPDTESPRVADGALLFGASNESQAQIFSSMLGPPSIANTYSQFFNKYAPQPTPSPGASVMQNQLMDILRQTIAATTAFSVTTQAGRAQMADFQRDAAAVERQLQAHGRTAAAAQLRAQIAQIRAAAPPPPGTPPNTLTVPPAVPTP